MPSPDSTPFWANVPVPAPVSDPVPDRDAVPVPRLDPWVLVTGASDPVPDRVAVPANRPAPVSVPEPDSPAVPAWAVPDGLMAISPATPSQPPLHVQVPPPWLPAPTAPPLSYRNMPSQFPDPVLARLVGVSPG